ncbi:hypothetical protein QR685DRAFT_441989, partial [Neurospora intermedia]
YTNKQFNFSIRIILLIKLVNYYLKGFIIIGNSFINYIITQSFEIIKAMETLIIELL